MLRYCKIIKMWKKLLITYSNFDGLLNAYNEWLRSYRKTYRNDELKFNPENTYCWFNSIHKY